MFTEDERKLLEKYVTSADDNVFGVKGMEGMIGAAYARYSRAKGGFREVLLNEFIKEGSVDPQHAEKLIERVLIAYGDDSVGELEGAHISFEQISMLATKDIEDRRIGGSPIEQSTRYVFYDQKNDDGHWKYLRHQSLLAASFGRQYEQTMDFIFQTYASLVEPMKEYYQKLKPLQNAEYDINGDGIKEHFVDLKSEQEQKAFRITYNTDVRTKACDTIRCLLPLSTLTNVGLFGNGRFFQHVISTLWTSDVPEIKEVGDKTFAAASKIIPQYVRRAKRSDYEAAVKTDMFRLVESLLSDVSPESSPQNPPLITLLDRNEELLERLIKSEKKSVKEALQEAADINTLGAMVYPFADYSMGYLRKIIAGFGREKRSQILETYIGKRAWRRDRPGRALEQGYPYEFDMLTNWGVYKDLMRHRMNTQTRQLFTTKFGFDLSPDLKDAGFEKQALEVVARSNSLFDTMYKESPLLAQYAVLHGSFIRWFIGMNDREAMHMLELRSTPQGHPNYRHAVQEMHKQVLERSKWRGEAMKFVDHKEYFWSRADSEARQRVEESIWEKKFGGE